MNPTVQRSLPLIPVVNPLMAGSLFRSEPQLGGRAVTWHDAESFKAEMGRQYGPSFQNWLSPKQRDQINAQAIKPKHAARIARALATSTQREAVMQFVDRHLSPQGQFRDPALARHYAHIALDEARARTGLPPLAKAPSEVVCALLFTPEIEKQIRRDLVAIPELFAGINPDRPVAEALLSAPGLRDEANLLLARPVAAALAERAENIAPLLPYLNAVEVLGLPSGPSSAIMGQLLEQPILRKIATYFESAFTGQMNYSRALTTRYTALHDEGARMADNLVSDHISVIEDAMRDTPDGAPDLVAHPHFRAAVERAIGANEYVMVDLQDQTGWLVFGALDVRREIRSGLLETCQNSDDCLKELVHQAGPQAARHLDAKSEAVLRALGAFSESLGAQRHHLDFYNLLWNDEIISGYMPIGEDEFADLRDAYRDLQRLQATPDSVKDGIDVMTKTLTNNSILGRVFLLGAFERASENVLYPESGAGRSRTIWPGSLRGSSASARNGFARSSATSENSLPAHLSNA